MRRLALVLALVVSAPALADDTPLIITQGQTQLDKPGNLVDIQPILTGEKAPEDGCYLSNKSCVALGQNKKALELEVDELSKRPEWWLVVVVAGVSLLAGGAATYAILHKQ